MAGFRFQIQHIKGSANTPADAISRWEGQVEVATAEEEEKGRQFVHALAPHALWTDQIPSIPVSKANIIRAQKGDLELSRVREILMMVPPMHASYLKGELPMV